MIELRPGSTHRVPILVLLPTERCNLDCDYCFAPRSGRVMEFSTVRETARAYADLCLETGSERATVWWQGGEVMTLDPEWVRAGVACFAEAFAPNPSCTVRHAVQTNLVAHTPAWNGLIHDAFDGYVSTSLDYPNTSRHIPNQPADDFEALWLARYRALEAAGIKVGLIAMIGSETLSLPPEAFLDYYYETIGVTHFQVGLPFPSQHRPGLPAGLHPGRFNEVAAFVGGLYRAWKTHHRHRHRDLLPFTVLERRRLVPQVALPCTWEADCTTEIVSVGVDGSVGACDCWVMNAPDACYGNIRDAGFAALLQGASRREFAARTSGLSTGACQGCRYWNWCHGGCPMCALAWLGSPDAQDPYCRVYQSIFDELHAPDA
jgi:uncharacterized protein